MDFVVLDFETTGLRNEDTIIEIGYVWIKDGTVKDMRSTLVNPGCSISRRITQITGITNAMVKDAPEIAEIIEKFSKFLRGKIIVAHNAGFDMRFLNNALEHAGLERINEYICTMRMFRGYKKKLGVTDSGAKLSDLTAYFGLHNDNAHRALDDAKVTADAFLQMNEVVKWEDWVSGKPVKKQSARAAAYMEHLDAEMAIEDIASEMNVKVSTVMKYFLEWINENNYNSYRTFLLTALPSAQLCRAVSEQARHEGRVKRLYQLFEGQIEFAQVQLILRLKQLEVLDAFMEELQ